MVDMRNGGCDVCGGEEIYTARIHLETPTALFKMLHAEKVNLYTCVSCGFVQMFLSQTEEQIHWVRNCWERV
ncbi:hypothetical protein AB0395_10845 [Streptosporangium sp. NPDC051023]|uniref:hypothetical protein n=1 Tax=Streptosporangium sp. NPDC051023 TaxID=3155410 RepID=UPI00344C4579